MGREYEKLAIYETSSHSLLACPAYIRTLFFQGVHLARNYH